MVAIQGFGIVGGVPKLENNDLSKIRELMEKLGRIRGTFYDPQGVWDINVNSDKKQLLHADSSYTNAALAPHVDGTYFTDSPGLQYFWIANHDGEGGETVLVDGFHLGHMFETYHPHLYEYLCAVSR